MNNLATLGCKSLGFKKQRVHQQTEISQCTFQTQGTGHSPKNQVHRHPGISEISAEQSMCYFSDKEERQSKS